jgi:beta-phosphoglucomutase-like phosphatase (HAD superfamily)
VQKGKPDPEIFIRSLQKLRIKNTECLVVEDSSGGIAAAKKAGLPVIGISTSHTEDSLRAQGCSRVISDYSSTDWLDSWS